VNRRIGAVGVLAVIVLGGSAVQSSAVVAAAAGSINVSCRLSAAPNPFGRGKYWFTISNQTPEQIRVTTGGGLVLAYVDSTALQARGGRPCRQARTAVRNVSGLAGPWSTNKRNRFACDSEQRVLRLTLSSVWNAKTRALSHRLVAALGGDTVARVVVTKRGGGIWVAAACIRLTS
jgi:hypothetical protein